MKYLNYLEKLISREKLKNKFYTVILLAIFIILILFFLLTFIYNYLSFYRDHLIIFFPENSIFYSHITLNKNIKNDLLTNNQLLTDLNNLLSIKKKDFDLIKFLEQIDKEVSLGLINQNNQLAFLLITKIKNPSDFVSPANQNKIKWRIINSDTLLFSDSDQLIRDAVQIAEENSLKEKLNTLKIKKFYFGSMGQAYINKDEIVLLNKFLNKDPAKRLLISSLILDYNNDIFICLKKVTNELKINITSLSSDSVPTFGLNPLPVKYLPPNSLLTFNSKNLKQNLENWYRNLDALNPQTKKDIDDFKTNLEVMKGYQIKTDEILSLLDRPAEMILLDYNLNDNKLFDFTKDNFVIILGDSFPDFPEIEGAAREILARLFPVIRERLLPDETKISELIADPFVFELKIDQISQPEKIKFYSLSVPNTNLKLVLGYFNNLAFLSNNSENITKILQKSTNYCQKYFSNQQDEIIFIDNKLYSQSILQPAQCLIIEERQKTTEIRIIF